MCIYTQQGYEVLLIYTPEYYKNIYMSENHTQLAKMSFDKIFDLTAGVYFHFL